MKERTALAFAALTSMTWGLTGIFVRLLPGQSPITITAARLMIGLCAALPFLFALPGPRSRIAHVLRQPVAYLLAGLLAGYYLLATAAFQRAPVAEAALLLNTPPLFVLAFRWMQGKPPARAEIGGALLALCGIALILGPRLSVAGTPDRAFSGHVFAICAAALTALYATIYRALSLRQQAPDAIGVSTLTFAVGSAVLGLGIVSTAVPTFGFALASRHLPPIVTATISLFIPVFAGVFAFLFLGETITGLFLAGCVLVLGGAAILIRGSQAG